MRYYNIKTKRGDWIRVTEKDMIYADTIVGRAVLRNLRYCLHKLNISFPIPFNDAIYTHAYCVQYGDESKEICEKL